VTISLYRVIQSDCKSIQVDLDYRSIKGDLE
jgi:hypothetical protein